MTLEAVLVIVGVVVVVLLIKFALDRSGSDVSIGFTIERSDGGLHRSEGTPGGPGTPFLGFPKFSAEEGNVETVLDRGDGVVTFDYAVQRGSGPSIPRTLRIPCAGGFVNVGCPVLSVSRRTLTGPPAVKGIPTVKFESGMFNTEFEVACTDGRFAHTLIDGRMMEWLLLLPTGWGIQTSGTRVLVFGQASERSTQSASVVEALQGFLAHVPPVVSSLYPPAG